MERQSTPERVSRRRQDPVSCRLCRLKKLKCSRQQPCSNCIARNTECEFNVNSTTRSARVQQDVEPSNSTILARLQRLEDMIVRMQPIVPQTPDSFSIRKPGSEASATSCALTPVETSHQVESQQLANIGIISPSLFPSNSPSWNFEAVPLDQILGHENANPGGRRRTIYVPIYTDARTLFDRYAEDVSQFHHIIHLPTLRKTLEHLYLKLAHKDLVDTDHVAILLAVFSTVLCYTSWTKDGSMRSAISTDCGKIFMLFFSSALDLLDHSRRTFQGSLEIVQTCIILVFLDYSLEGFTSRARATLAQGIHAAKNLSLHSLDSPAASRRRHSTATTEKIIDIEMKRRIWWHMVATDWMVSLAGSAQEGTYNVHPQQMRVHLPRNIDDSVLERGDVHEDPPLHQPSSMCYPLHRIRLGELSRTVVDTMRFGIADSTDHDYSQVLLLDKRIEHFIEDLPIFFKLDENSIHRSRHVLEKYPYMAMQRYIINIGALSIRCKLHQPFLVRNDGKPRFTQSVEICLTSAMAVIDLNKALKRDPTRYFPEKVKLVGLLHHMFLATIVLVMDVCFNRANESNDPRSLEIIDAIRMLEDAKEKSVSAQKFLDSLSEALKKHQISLKNDMRTPLGDNHPIPQAQQATSHPWTPMVNDQMPQAMTQAGIQNGAQTVALGFEDFWRDTMHYQGNHSNMLDWDQLFSELDTFIS